MNKYSHLIHPELTKWHPLVSLSKLNNVIATKAKSKWLFTAITSPSPKQKKEKFRKQHSPFAFYASHCLSLNFQFLPSFQQQVGELSVSWRSTICCDLLPKSGHSYFKVNLAIKFLSNHESTYFGVQIAEHGNHILNLY